MNCRKTKCYTTTETTLIQMFAINTHQIPAQSEGGTPHSLRELRAPFPHLLTLDYGANRHQLINDDQTLAGDDSHTNGILPGWMTS